MKTTSPAYGFRAEEWLYHHHIEGAGDEVSLTFVDECRCGAYELKNHADLLRVRAD